MSAGTDADDGGSDSTGSDYETDTHSQWMTDFQSPLSQVTLIAPVMEMRQTQEMSELQTRQDGAVETDQIPVRTVRLVMTTMSKLKSLSCL